MKKFFRKAFLFIALGAMSLTTTSCDNETIQQVVSMLITNLTNLNGQTYQYQCQGSTELLEANGNDGFNSAGKGQFSGVFSVRYTGTSANVSVPAMTVAGASMSLVNIQGLALTAQNGYTAINVPDEGVNGEGTLTINGQTYTLSNIYIDEALTNGSNATGTATSEKVSFKTLQLFFGDNYEYVVSLTNVSGSVLAQ